MQAEKALVEEEAGKERAQHERVQQEARRRESRIRTIAFAALALIVVLIVTDRVYVRSNRYQIGSALAAGQTLEADSSISQDALREWRRTLAASGRVADAQASARRQTDPAQRAVMLAEAAVWFSRTGQGDAAIQTATEALKPLEAQMGGANLETLSSVLAVLADANLLEPDRPSLATFLAAVKNVPDPLHRPTYLARIARFPPFGAARDEILRLADSIPDRYDQFRPFMIAANAAKDAKDQKRQDAALAGARLAAHKWSPDRRRSDALAEIAALSQNPDDWNNALSAARTLTPPEARVDGLTKLISAAADSEKSKLIKETFVLAESLAPVPRLNALLALVDGAVHSLDAKEIDNALKKHALELADEDIARAAVALAHVGDMDNSIGTARALTAPVAQARTLAQVAEELQKSTPGGGGQKSASQLVLQAFQADSRNEQLAAELIHVLPYLYPSSDAYKAVVDLNKPAAYLAWAKAAGGSDAAEQYLRKAKDLTLAMTTDNTDRADLLGQIGVLYANRGKLSDSREIAKLATSPNAQLEIYTAILRYDAIQSRPEAKEFLTRPAGR